MKMSNLVMRLLAASALVSVSLLGATTSARADDVKMYKTAPSVEELEKVLGGSNKPKAKTRSIVFGDESAAPAPAPQQAEPAAYQPPAPAPEPAPAPQQASQRQQAPAPAKAPAPKKVSAPAPAPAQAVEVSEAAVGFPINFDLGSASIRADSRPFLDAIAGLLRKDTGMRLLIEGHTDASGDYVRNMELSRARAASVLADLMARYGIEPTRLQAVGKGPTEPLNSATPYSPDNRRVQFRVIGG